MTNSQSVVEYRYQQQGLCYKQQVHLKELRDYNRKTVRNYLGRIDQKRKQKQTKVNPTTPENRTCTDRQKKPE